jgi:hypothetical protein
MCILSSIEAGSADDGYDLKQPISAECRYENNSLPSDWHSVARKVLVCNLANSVAARFRVFKLSIHPLRLLLILVVLTSSVKVEADETISFETADGRLPEYRRC